MAERLGEAGAEDVRLDTFRYQHSFASAQAAHFLAGAVAPWRPLAAAALASFELEYSGRSQWLRRLLPAGEGSNALAVLPAVGEPRRTLVLVAHHDAAHTGLMWNPRLLASPSFALLPETALLVTSLTRRRPLRLGAAAILGLAAALVLQSAASSTVPGANDNATGVAGMLALCERLAEDRPEGLEVIALAPGCEESGMGGMAAWLAGEGSRLDPGRTLVLGLDTIGSGEPVVLRAEGGLWPVHYRASDLALAGLAAAQAGIPLPRWRIGGWTDPVLARLAGLPALSLVSVRDEGFPNYHLPTDTPDRVDWGSVDACLALAEAIIEVWASQPG